MGRRIVTNREMAEIDRRSHEEFALPSLVLMEAAGLKAWLAARSFLWGGSITSEPCVFLAGRGNNGGDALVMARHAHAEGLSRLSVILGSDRLKGDAEAELEMVRRLGIPVYSWETGRDRAEEQIRKAAFLFDGLSGTGQAGPLRADSAAIVECVNASARTVVSLDIPSGLYDGIRKQDPVIRADHTITMGLPKLCMYLPVSRTLCGSIHTVDPGFPPVLTDGAESTRSLLEDGELSSLLPRIEPDVYKNRRGTVAVFAGAPGTTGAAELCASAALRSRAGLVTLFPDPEAYLPLASRLSAVMVKPLSETADPRTFDFSPYTALLAGPGWGVAGKRLPWLRALIASGLPGVLDADGIRLLSRLREEERIDLGGRWILTPHPGEFAGLVSLDDREELLSNPVPYLLEASSRVNAVIILKGHVSLLGTPEGNLKVLDGMNPALATGGSGDVFSGIAAGILAGGVPAVRAAETALLMQRRIGIAAFREYGWFTSEDLLACISREFARV